MALLRLLVLVGIILIPVAAPAQSAQPGDVVPAGESRWRVIYNMGRVESPMQTAWSGWNYRGSEIAITARDCAAILEKLIETDLHLGRQQGSSVRRVGQELRVATSNGVANVMYLCYPADQPLPGR